MVRLLAINPNKQISVPPPTPLKKFGTPPPLPSNLNSDWSLRLNTLQTLSNLRLFAFMVIESLFFLLLHLSESITSK